MINIPWAIKHRPKSINEYIFQEPDNINLFNKWKSEGIIPHLLLKGHRGTGKTTLAMIIKNEFEIDDIDFLFINASKENSVETIRNKVHNFISIHAFSKFKIVFMDEADWLTPNAQGVLRSMLEDEAFIQNARFIFTCNKPHKIINEIKSRCQEIEYKSMDKVKMLEGAVKILVEEKVKVKSIDTLEFYLNKAYPDFRKFIQLLEQNSIDGELKLKDVNATLSDDLSMLLENIINNQNFFDHRQELSACISTDEWEDVYRYLYENLHKIGKFKDLDKWKQGIVVISEHLYRHVSAADAEINAAGMFISLELI